MNMGLVKELSGGGKQKARYLNSNKYVEYEPQLHLQVICKLPVYRVPTEAPKGECG